MRTRIGFVAVCAVWLASGLVGCSSSPPLRQTGFLSTYDNLRPAGENRMRYISPELRDYTAFIVDPVESRLEDGVLSPDDRAAALNYFREAMIRAIRAAGFAVTDDVGPHVARVRLALTGVAKSEWWMKLYPAARFSGAGTGGAAMEGEVIDSMTGRELGAVVQAASGNQFNLANFSTLSDVESAIDKWADNARQRLEEMRADAKRTN